LLGRNRAGSAGDRPAIGWIPVLSAHGLTQLPMG